MKIYSLHMLSSSQWSVFCFALLWQIAVSMKFNCLVHTQLLLLVFVMYTYISLNICKIYTIMKYICCKLPLQFMIYHIQYHFITMTCAFHIAYLLSSVFAVFKFHMKNKINFSKSIY